MSTEIYRMFRAFSDRTRLRTFHLLLDGEMCVGDLEEVLRVSQTTASRHLCYPREAGLVEVRRDGRSCLYSLAKARSGSHRGLLSCFEEVPDLRLDADRAERLAEVSGCCADPESTP